MVLQEAIGAFQKTAAGKRAEWIGIREVTETRRSHSARDGHPESNSISSSRGAMNEGAVKLSGSTWTAYPIEGEEPLEAGERVRIEKMEGASLYVSRLDREPDWRNRQLPE